MKWTPSHVQILLWLAFQDVKTRNANSKVISESWPEFGGETPSPRAIQEKLIAIKNGVVDLGLAEFFSSGGVGVPRSKRAASRSNGKNAKHIAQFQQAGQQDRRKHMLTPSTELWIEDVSSTQRQLSAQAPSIPDEKHNKTLEDDDIDGETATESDIDSEVIIVDSRPVRKRAREADYSFPKLEFEEGNSRKARPVRKQADEAESAKSRAFRFKSEAGGDVSPLATELRSVPMRIYQDGRDVEFDSDSEPITSERQRKKPRIHHEWPVKEKQSGTAKYPWLT